MTLDELLELMLPGEAFVSLVSRPAWHARAACCGVGPEMFFVGTGGDTAPGKALCAGCTVQAECHEAGQGEVGIWAGTSQRQRHPLEPPTVPACPVCGGAVSPTGRPGRPSTYCGDACRRARSTAA